MRATAGVVEGMPLPGPDRLWCQSRGDDHPRGLGGAEIAEVKEARDSDSDGAFDLLAELVNCCL